jgi:hypothetical protein
MTMDIKMGPLTLTLLSHSLSRKTNNTKARLLVTIVLVVDFGTGCIINGPDQPQKSLGVDFLGESVARIFSLNSIQWYLKF